MKEFWIFQTGEPLNSDNEKFRGMRAINLANQLIKNNHKVRLFSSDFFHQKKIHRFNKYKIIKISNMLEIHLIPSPGYKSNMGFKRLFDHLILSLNLKKSLDKIPTIPDAAFVGYPPIEFAYVASNWLSLKSVPFIIDVKDKWPHIFLRALPKILNPLGFLFLFPYFVFGQKAIKKASLVCANSQSFLNWALKFGKRKDHQKIGFIAPLVPIRKIYENDLNISKKWWKTFNIFEDDDIVNIVFIGSLSKGFNFKPVAKAAKMFAENNANLRFIICGSGEEMNNIKGLFDGLNNTVFPGWVNEQNLQTICEMSMLAIAPYVSLEDFKISIPNKIYDYLYFSLPILTSLEGETKSFVEKNNVGNFYEASKENDLYKKILKIKNNHKTYEIMKNNCKKMAKEFSGDLIYQKIVDKLNTISG